MRALTLRGAEIIAIPLAGAVGEWPEGLFEAEMRAAAFQNAYFTALANRVGREEVLKFAGGFSVCNPLGQRSLPGLLWGRDAFSTPTATFLSSRPRRRAASSCATAAPSRCRIS